MWSASGRLMGNSHLADDAGPSRVKSTRVVAIGGRSVPSGTQQRSILDFCGETWLSDGRETQSDCDDGSVRGRPSGNRGLLKVGGQGHAPPDGAGPCRRRRQRRHDGHGDPAGRAPSADSSRDSAGPVAREALIRDAPEDSVSRDTITRGPRHGGQRRSSSRARSGPSIPRRYGFISAIFASIFLTSAGYEAVRMMSLNCPR